MPSAHRETLRSPVLAVCTVLLASAVLRAADPTGGAAAADNELAVKVVGAKTDLAGPGDSGPDGQPDVCLEVPIARDRIRSVRVEGENGDAWRTPYNGSSWDVKLAPGDGDAVTRLHFAPSLTKTAYRVTLLLDSDASMSGVATLPSNKTLVDAAPAGKADPGTRWKPTLPPSAATSYFVQPGDVVLFLGNSITDRMQVELDALVDDWRTRYPELVGSVTLHKFGVGGEPASEAVRRVKGLLGQFKPTVCVICYGTCEMTFPEQSGYPAALTDIVRQLEEGGARVTVVAPPPVSAANWQQPPAFVAEKFTQGLRVLAGQARQVAAQEGAVFVDAHGALDQAMDAGIEFTVDGVHLNADGYRVMADALQAAWGFGAPLRPAGPPR